MWLGIAVFSIMPPKNAINMRINAIWDIQDIILDSQLTFYVKTATIYRPQNWYCSSS